VTSAVTYGADGKPNAGLISRLDAHRALILQALGEAADSCGADRAEYAAQGAPEAQ
jgi:hypothetical protein